MDSYTDCNHNHNNKITILTITITMVLIIMIMWILIIIIINLTRNKEERSPKTMTKFKLAKISKQKVITPYSYPLTLLQRYPVFNPPEKQLYNSKTRHDIGHWSWKEKVKMWEILHLLWANIQEWIDRRHWVCTEINILAKVIS